MIKDRKVLLASLALFLARSSEVYGASFSMESISKSYIFLSMVLLLGFIGFIVEFFSKKFGPGILLSIFAFTSFFMLNSTALPKTSYVSYFIIGLILLIIEVIIPGFSITGILGFALISLSIILTVPNMAYGIVMLVVTVSISLLILRYLIKKGYRSGAVEKLVLSEDNSKKVNEMGERNLRYLNKEGKVISDMRPSGSIEIDGEILDAISEGLYIKKGESIEVIKIEGNKIIVRRI